MQSDIQHAMELLAHGSYTCVLCRGDAVFTDTRRGIRPLLELWESSRDLRNFSAADKVVGKAAAMMYCLLGVHAVHAPVLSRPALQALQRHGINVTWDTLVDAIRSRDGAGFCPMESAVMAIDDPALAPAAVKAALEKLQHQ